MVTTLKALIKANRSVNLLNQSKKCCNPLRAQHFFDSAAGDSIPNGFRRQIPMSLPSQQNLNRLTDRLVLKVVPFF
jgi:hypothetical protein